MSAEQVTPRSWEVALPPGLELLSMNGREHFMARARTFKSLKTAAWAMLKNAKVPPLDRVTVRVIYDPPDRRPRDPDNLGATVKPLVDAIVAAGIIPDDNSRHVVWAHAEIGPEVRKPSRLRIVITEVVAGAEAA
jgi:crossover junction endodeoxyribonuclease RusA